MSDSIYKERIPCSNGQDIRCNVIDIEVYYDLGGYNYFSGSEKKRGYYLSVSPLEVDGHFVSYQGFSGMYMLLNECSRKSKKAESEALKLMEEKKDVLISAVCNKHGIELIKKTA